MKTLTISPIIHKLSDVMVKMSAEEEMVTDTAVDPGLAEPATADPSMVEEKDQDTLLQEHVKNNQDKYRLAFEALFPKAQMVAKNVEYHGAVTKDKVRVSVDFETPILNFDALQIMSGKEVGIEATGEKTFRVYNIFLPKAKDSALK
jgi:galactose-1-phosphate uridylyltransferase